MASVEQLKHDLINKILAIKSKEFLEKLDHLVSANRSLVETAPLTKEQIDMLEMSERDISKGLLISQEDMDKRNLEWLNAL